MNYCRDELFDRMLNGEMSDEELFALNELDYKLTDEQREEYIRFIMSCYGQTYEEAKFYMGTIK
ncbi:hypothetical protein M3690_04190 [Priestia megaterium]|uniref:hypothetical protein n=1 Tax=Priestia megaterium TaxID=1404 RepID=UPI0020408FF3|nr:hypothetical protein [Priestia megaterium]MCM3792491.1 hypothetical protein [Priestia megaterium]